MTPVDSQKGFILALGGGGGRGLAHLGVLQALEENHLRPSAIVGTSIGSLFGAMYALTLDAAALRAHVETFLNTEAFTHLDLPLLVEAETEDHTWLGKLTAAARESVLYARAATRTSLTDADAVLDIVRTLCKNKEFSDVQIPLYITTVGFPAGEIEIFAEGDLTRAIAASMAIPGVFAPVKIGAESFVDGGLACELPAKEAKKIAGEDNVVMAIDVGARPRPNVEPDTVVGMLDWAMRIKAFYLRQYKAEFADILVEPIPGFRQWSDFSHPDEEINRGHEATLEHIPELLRLMNS
jgi:NTE family protein